MDVSIIIVNYNTYALTKACIRSIEDFTKGVHYEIILVDNASTECDPQVFIEAFPKLTLLQSPQNTGFAGGNNLGLRHAQGRVLLLLNSDTLLEEDTVSKAVAYLEAHPTVGALTVGLYYPDGRVQHYARRYKSAWFEMLDLARPLLYLLPYRRRAALMLNQYYNNDFDVACDWVGGAFLMMPRKALEDLGGQLDSRYFMYGEDQLWCMQLEARGWERHCFSGARVVHLEGGSARPNRKKRWNKLLWKREIELYALRWGSGIGYWTFIVIFTLKRSFAFALLKLMGK